MPRCGPHWKGRYHLGILSAESLLAAALRPEGLAQRAKRQTDQDERAKCKTQGRRFFYSSNFLLRFFLFTFVLFYLMILSARASTFDGIVRPICLAVLRLITNSNFIGCSTGRSAGLAPLRILSTYIAARRDDSPLMGP